MFTKKGEVNKKGAIKKFLPEDIATDFFIFSNPPDVSGEISVEFLENDLVAYTEYGNLETKTLTRKNGILYLEANETGTIFLSNNYGFSFSDIVKYTPLYTDTSVISSSSGFQDVVKVKDCIYLEPAGTEIRLPIFSFYFKHTDGQSVSASAVRQNNAFNKKGLKNLTEKDTLVVQEIYITLRKQ